MHVELELLSFVSALVMVSTDDRHLGKEVDETKLRYIKNSRPQIHDDDWVEWGSFRVDFYLYSRVICLYWPTRSNFKIQQAPSILALSKHHSRFCFLWYNQIGIFVGCVNVSHFCFYVTIKWRNNKIPHCRNNSKIKYLSKCNLCLF